jgi:glycosyltransferase involved in cell wall biosynthesis
MRRQWGIQKDVFTFGVVGRLSEEKGCRVAIEAFCQMLEEAGSSKKCLLFAGDGPLKGALRELVEQRDAGRNITFVGFSERPWEVYAVLDALLLPSRSEGLPMSLLEAMACGCWPIATRVGGIPEVLSDPSVGRLVECDGGGTLLDAMREATRLGSSRLREMGVQARVHVLRHFNADVQLKALARLIEGRK